MLVWENPPDALCSSRCNNTKRLRQNQLHGSALWLKTLTRCYSTFLETIHSLFRVTSLKKKTELKKNPGCLFPTATVWSVKHSLSSTGQLYNTPVNQTVKHQTENHRSKALCFVFSILRYVHELQYFANR